MPNRGEPSERGEDALNLSAFFSRQGFVLSPARRIGSLPVTTSPGQIAQTGEALGADQLLAIGLIRAQARFATTLFALLSRAFAGAAAVE